MCTALILILNINDHDITVLLAQVIEVSEVRLSYNTAINA